MLLGWVTASPAEQVVFTRECILAYCPVARFRRASHCSFRPDLFGLRLDIRKSWLWVRRRVAEGERGLMARGNLALTFRPEHEDQRCRRAQRSWILGYLPLSPKAWRRDTPIRVPDASKSNRAVEIAIGDPFSNRRVHGPSWGSSSLPVGWFLTTRTERSRGRRLPEQDSLGLMDLPDCDPRFHSEFPVNARGDMESGERFAAEVLDRQGDGRGAILGSGGPLVLGGTYKEGLLDGLFSDGAFVFHSPKPSGKSPDTNAYQVVIRGGRVDHVAHIELAPPSVPMPELSPVRGVENRARMVVGALVGGSIGSPLGSDAAPRRSRKTMWGSTSTGFGK